MLYVVTISLYNIYLYHDFGKPHLNVSFCGTFYFEKQLNSCFFKLEVYLSLKRFLLILVNSIKMFTC